MTVRSQISTKPLAGTKILPIAKSTLRKRAPNLPNKPSALLRVAIRDVRKIMKINSKAFEKNKNEPYVFNMAEWHNVRKYGASSTVCHVCLAGSVISQTLGIRRTNEIGPAAVGDYIARRFKKPNLSTPLTQKLYALNSFRTGNILGGLTAFLDITSKEAHKIELRVARRMIDRDLPATTHQLDKLFAPVVDATSNTELLRLLALLSKLSDALKAEGY